jgi:hypothetical protein
MCSALCIHGSTSFFITASESDTGQISVKKGVCSTLTQTITHKLPNKNPAPAGHWLSIGAACNHGCPLPAVLFGIDQSLSNLYKILLIGDYRLIVSVECRFVSRPLEKVMGGGKKERKHR